MRVRPFVRIAGNLSLTVSDLSRQYPGLQSAAHAGGNPPSGSAAPDEAPAAEPDAEVAFVDARSRADDAALKIAGSRRTTK